MRFFFLILISFLLLGTAAGPEAPLFRPGKDHALFIAVDNYQHWNDLQYPVKDVGRIAAELENYYGFTTETLRNPTRRQVLDKLAEYCRKQFAKDGQLLVFFSGHGEFDTKTKEGFFVPVNGLKEDLYQETYLPLSRLKRAIPCDHILLAIDACYSGAVDDRIALRDDDETPPRFGRPGSRNGMSPAEIDQIVKDRLRTKTRLYFTSGGLEQTPDRSEFVNKFLEALGATSRKEPIIGYDGHRYFLGKARPRDFITVARQKIGPYEAEERMLAAWQTAKARNDCDTYTTFAEDYPQSPYAGLVRNRLKTLGCGSVAPPDNMVFIKGGTFQMGDQFGDGSDDEKPVHVVTLSDFYLSRTELTNREFAEFLSSQGNQEQGGTEWYDLESSRAQIVGSGRSFSPKSGQEDHPVLEVSWYGAVAYCNWLSGQHGLKPVYRVSGTTVTSDWNANGYRLPTEAEWEYAARSGGKKHRFGNGQNTISSTNANFNASASYKKDYSVAGEYRGKTVSVGSFAPNTMGLVDMSGNVYEWCWDWYAQDYYGKSSGSNPRGPSSGTDRIIRGGSWFITPSLCRAADRGNSRPTYRISHVGFRLARSY